MKKCCAFVVALSVLILAGKSWASPSDSLGLAESKAIYKIARADAILDAKADTLTKLLDGDRVEAADKPVRVQTSGGDTVMVQGNSAAEFAGAEKIKLVSGDILVAVGKDSKLAVGVEDLLVTPLKSADKKAGQQIVAVARPGEGVVKISGFNQPIAVKAAGSEDQLAVVGTNDTVELKKTPKGWVVAQATNGTKPATKPAGPGYKADEPAKKEEKRRQGGAWWLSPIGLAAGTIAIAGIAVGTGVIVKNNNDDNDDDDDDDDDRGPASRINPPSD
jgi:nitroreductase